VLAYVFTHRPAANTDLEGYEDVLRRFHEELAGKRPRGFVRSLTYRLDSAYSDWYLLEDSAALDPLNEAAVTGGRAAAHEAAARMAADGIGKLMTLAAGSPDAEAPTETRFVKPSGMAYGDLYSTLERWTREPGTSLWRRMMVLGPPPEFCLLSPKEVALPAEMHPETFERTPI
jgi:hypothetical protein